MEGHLNYRWLELCLDDACSSSGLDPDGNERRSWQLPTIHAGKVHLERWRHT
jgi:hypothetical protein